MTAMPLLPRRKAPEKPAADNTEEQEELDEAALAESHERDRRSRLAHLYTHAGDLEVELGDLARRNPDADLTPAQIGRYNQILRDARELVPNSVALKEDATEIEETTDAVEDDAENAEKADAIDNYRVADIHRWLHTTVVPTLHNALPEEEYDRRS